MMLSTKKAKFLLKIIIPVFISVFSFCVLSAKIPETKFVKSSVENLEENKVTVLELSGAAMAASLAISALPGDFASPMANTLSDMNTYFIIILLAIFLERLILVEGIKLSFMYLVPVICGLFIINMFVKKNILISFAYKLIILSASLIIVIPCSTHFANYVCSDYMAYIEETIEETNEGSRKINDVAGTGSSDENIFDKLTDAFSTAIKGVNDLLEYFKNIIKKCINSIVIMVVNTCLIPIITLLFFKWLLKELFGMKISVPRILDSVQKVKDKIMKRTSDAGEEA